MNYIYLDTSHLIKWQNKTLDAADLVKLDKLTSCGEYLFVISTTHRDEIANRINRNQIQELFSFIQKLPFVMLLPIFELFKWEVINATKILNGLPVSCSPFSNDTNQLFPEGDIEQFLLSYSEQQNLQLNLDNLVKNVASSVIETDQMNNYDPQSFEIFLNEKLKDRLQLILSEINVLVDKEKLINHIIADKKLIPSLRINFFSFFYLCRDKTRVKTIKVNHWNDILHYSAIPYVDYFTADGESCSNIRKIRGISSVLDKVNIASSMSSLFKSVKL